MELRRFAAAIALGLAGCGGGGGTTSQVPFAGCPAIVAAQDTTLTLISPARGATGVSPTVGTIAFSGSFAYASVTLSPHDGTGQITSGPVIAANGVDTATIPTLHSGVLYDVQPLTMPMPSVPGCTFQSFQYAGSFTTR